MPNKNFTFKQRPWWQEKKTREASDYAFEHGFPPLTGSQSQIDWALCIRHAVIQKCRKEAQEHPRKRKAVINFTMNYLLKQRSAKWWIERREDTLHDLAQEMRTGRRTPQYNTVKNARR